MPSEYQVLDNRPIDKWKVAELKEELKRRKLTTKGLKEDLIKRLDEAVRIEREAAGEEINNGVDDPERKTVDEVAKTEGTIVGESEIGIPVNAVETVDGDNGNISEVEAVSLPVDVKDSAEQPNQKEVLEQKESELVSHEPTRVEVSSITNVPSAGVSDQVCESLASETAMDGQRLQDDEPERDNEKSRAQQESEDIKPPHEDVTLDTSDPNNQVSEVDSNLGSPIKSHCVSTDSVSICEKNELKDNIMSDNVKLEFDVKPEMVQSSSSNLVAVGKSHPKDVEEPLEMELSVGETNNNVTNADMSQKNISTDLGSSEKLNLDRSSGDDSMEEDALESKQIDPNYNSGEVGVRSEKSEVTTLKEEAPVTAMDSDLPAKDKSVHFENKGAVAASSDKRKLQDQEADLNSEPSKRQRRWKSEGSDARERPLSTIPLVASKDVPQPASLKRNLSRSHSGRSNDTPKEREVPPSTKAPTNSLRIDNFLRPFTLKAVQELLGKTGTVTCFWMDHIKTHCYITYSSVEEAVATRSAVYNLQWPPNGGPHLVAEFVDPQEVKVRVDPLPQPLAAPLVTASAAAPEPSPKLRQPSPRLQDHRQQLSKQIALPLPPALSNPAPARAQAHPPRPPPEEKVEAPIVTLDDLFRKTKTAPRIYYLPLSEEQVSATLEARQKNSRQQ